MNVIWSTLLIICLIVMLFVNPSQILNIFVSAGTNALTLCLSLTSVYFVWLGIFEIISRLKVIEKLRKIIQPMLYLLFGRLSEKASELISLNFAVNLLGVGGAATPSAIKAIEEMDTTNDTDKATSQMVMLFVINATSIQLLPTTVMGMRASMNSLSPADIVLPTIVATFITTFLGIFLVKLAYRKDKRYV